MKCNRLSASRIRTYEQCPMKYYYAYEEGVKEVIEKDHLLFGTLLHTCLERYYKEDKDIIDIFKEEWEKTNLSNYEHFKEGKSILKKFVKENPKEDAIIFELEKEFETEIEGVPLKAFIDRIDYDPERNLLQVIDYKSSFIELSDDEAEIDIQLGLYDLLCSYEYPEYDNILAMFYYLRSGEVSGSIHTPEDREEFKEYVKTTYNKIINDDNPIAKINPYCHWCVAKHRCEEYQKALEQNYDVVVPEDKVELYSLRKDLRDKKKLIEKKLDEIDNTLKKYIEEEGEFVIDNDIKITSQNYVKKIYPLDMVKKYVDNWEKYISLSKTKIDKAVDKETKEILENNAQKQKGSARIAERKVKKKK